MGRVYGELVEVRTREDGCPVSFAWRGRRYAVVSVQEFWIVNRDWWREPAPLPARPELQFWRVEASQGRGGYLPEGQPSLSPGGLRDEAARVYRTGHTGTYELRRDIAAGTWTLRRVAD